MILAIHIGESNRGLSIRLSNGCPNSDIRCFVSLAQLASIGQAKRINEVEDWLLWANRSACQGALARQRVYAVDPLLIL